MIAALAEELVGFILNVGIPKEIRVSNILVEAGLEQICDVCGIKLRRVEEVAGDGRISGWNGTVYVVFTEKGVSEHAGKRGMHPLYG